MGGELGGEWTDVYGCPPETITTLLVGYTPMHNKKLNK